MPKADPSMLIDLHTHSSVSDGTQTPTQLMRAAVAAELDVVALTDHDSTAGWQEAMTAASGTGVLLIPGIELSTRIQYASVHVLGYLFDPLDAEIVAETARIRDGRLHRAERIVERLAVDYDLTWDDVLAQSSMGATIGRPHIADALVARGHVPNRSAAFASMLHWRTGYVEPHYAPSPRDGIRMIAEAGGVPVLAHPATHGRSSVVAESHLRELIDVGLAGLEIGHRENTEAGRAQLRRYAEKYDLIVTGSSDYHGDGKPNRLAENSTAPDQLERILALGSGSEPFQG
ncbi:PHP domain-containing protein [Diaminobutyricimonas sp. LJ205]|uniref:PHP domain-containing protein n=1 Tax=Diaminobutyricimonas sp. LJ205 TaxID=2683590 RepID=UPI0012F47A26|nr:PHP domain-containing protein [Diaminobutyricimonas sp. LJ205]